MNLKRFDVPKIYGGICPNENPVQWIRDTIRQTIDLGLGVMEGVRVTYFLPEALLLVAKEVLQAFPREAVGSFQIGCQGVYREDVAEGKNFGAFTTNRPAAAMHAIGCDQVMIGHSEERKDKLSLLTCYDFTIESDADAYSDAVEAVEKILNSEVQCALARGMNVLYCVGETAEQKGSNDPVDYKPRVRRVLKDQICRGLAGIGSAPQSHRIAIGYEPIWAIGPGKTPPNAEYVEFVSSYIKEVCRAEFGIELPVVYGGGLKEENADEMASISTLDGGLVALTKFTAPIAFDVQSLKNIIQAYMK